MTTAEKTMLQFGHPDQVRQFRQLFENEMTERLTSMVEDLTGRKVVNYQSQVMFDPDLIVDMFVVDHDGPKESRAATAEAQLDDNGAGSATDENVLGRASEDGNQRERSLPAELAVVGELGGTFG